MIKAMLVSAAHLVHRQVTQLRGQGQGVGQIKRKQNVGCIKVYEKKFIKNGGI